MPAYVKKRWERNKTNVVISLPPSVKLKLQAIAYQVGNKGLMSKIARRFVLDGIERYEAELSQAKARELREIMSHVLLRAELEQSLKDKKAP